MEKERSGITSSEHDEFIKTVRKAQNGDKESMHEILEFFKSDIEYLSKYIMLPKEDAIQSLKTELMNIVHQQL